VHRNHSISYADSPPTRIHNFLKMRRLPQLHVDCSGLRSHVICSCHEYRPETIIVVAANFARQVCPTGQITRHPQKQHQEFCLYESMYTISSSYHPTRHANTVPNHHQTSKKTKNWLNYGLEAILIQVDCDGFETPTNLPLESDIEATDQPAFFPSIRNAKTVPKHNRASKKTKNWLNYGLEAILIQVD